MHAAVKTQITDFQSDLVLAGAPELAASFDSVKGHCHMRAASKDGHVLLTTTSEGQVELVLGFGDRNAPSVKIAYNEAGERQNLFVGNLVRSGGVDYDAHARPRALNAGADAALKAAKPGNMHDGVYVSQFARALGVHHPATGQHYGPGMIASASHLDTNIRTEGAANAVAGIHTKLLDLD